MTGNGAYKVTQQRHYETAPRAQGSPGPQGQVAAIATSAVAGVLDLTKLVFGLAYDPHQADTATGTGAPATGPQGVVGSFITVCADTSDLGIIVGPTLASVTTTNVPALATVGTVNASGVYTQVAGVCRRIPLGTFIRFRLEVGRDNFLGFVASGAGVMRVYQSSAPGLTA